MEFQLCRAFEPVIRALISQHYSVESGDVCASAQLHRELLCAIRAKNEPGAMRLVRVILSQGIAVLEKRYSE